MFDWTTVHRLLIAISMSTAVYSCATSPETLESRQENFERIARANDNAAEEWRSSGNDEIAQYHENEARKARHNKFATGCGLMDILIFDIVLGSDTCETH